MGAALTPAGRSPRTRARPASEPAQRFVDFSIRAWLEGYSVGVIAHSSPVGGMRAPAFVRIGDFDARAYRLPLQADWAAAATLGRELARWLLPPPVWALLVDSLRALGALPGTGLRLRLCLADELIDLPWEYLYRPDVADAARPRSGFLLMDSRLSLVREPPTLLARPEAVGRKQRGLFVGTLWSDHTDGWGVKQEFRSLKRSLAPLSDLVEIDSVWADDADGVQAQLARGCDFFHYAGHVDIDGSQASLVALVNPAVAQAT
nr:hypothetical protein [Thiobacillaceae bacterium]